MARIVSLNKEIKIEAPDVEHRDKKEGEYSLDKRLVDRYNQSEFKDKEGTDENQLDLSFSNIDNHGDKTILRIEPTFSKYVNVHRELVNSGKFNDDELKEITPRMVHTSVMQFGYDSSGEIVALYNIRGSHVAAGPQEVQNIIAGRMSPNQLLNSDPLKASIRDNAHSRLYLDDLNLEEVSLGYIADEYRVGNCNAVHIAKTGLINPEGILSNLRETGNKQQIEGIAIVKLDDLLNSTISNGRMLTPNMQIYNVVGNSSLGNPDEVSSRVVRPLVQVMIENMQDSSEFTSYVLGKAGIQR